jgi:hypothetical protein
VSEEDISKVANIANEHYTMHVNSFLLAGLALAFGSSHALELKWSSLGKENSSTNEVPARSPRVDQEFEEEECSICLQSMSNARPHEVTTMRCCPNRFHVACIEKWAVRGSTCPICRHDIREHRKPIDAPHEDELLTWPSFRDYAINTIAFVISGIQLEKEKSRLSNRFHLRQLLPIATALAVWYCLSQLLGIVIFWQRVYVARKAYRQHATFLANCEVTVEFLQHYHRIATYNYHNRQYWIQKMRDNPHAVNWVSADHG